MYAEETGKQTAEKKVAAKCSAKWRRHRKRHAHRHTLRHTHTLIHWLRRRHMLDNKTIQLKRSGRGWDSVQRCAGKWKQQWEIEGGANYAGKWVKKHFQADCSSRKGWKINFNKLLGKKKEKFSLVKGELKAQSALWNDCIKAIAATAASALNWLWT